MSLTITKRRVNIWLTFFTVAFLCVGLLLRDVGGIGISKYVFLIAVMPSIFLLETRFFLALASVLIPMFVGLPGNYISLCLLLRLIWEQIGGKLWCNFWAYIWTILVSVYLFAQNLIYDYTAIYNMMGAIDFLTLLLFLCAVLRYNETENVITAYLVGVVATGAIMLISTLQYYDLQDLMDSATRLGDTGMLQQALESGMVISIDPNFYGMNVIAAVSAAVNVLLVRKTSVQRKVITISLCVAAIILALIGLSRAFALVLIAWGIVLMLVQGNIKKTLATQLLVIVLTIILLVSFPTVIEGIFKRFNEDNVAGGNGRINLILEYAEEWNESIWTVFFGIGLYNCFTHSTPFLYLFGIGIVGTIIVFCWFACVIRISSAHGEKGDLKKWLPFLVTFVLYSAIPAAGAINYTYPLVVAILALALNTTGKEQLR